MILIRGIKNENYARKIEKGIVDCRDVLSTILLPPTTGYEYSDYYERNLVTALAYCAKKESENLHDPELLYSLLIDYFVPYIYLTYFHILNPCSLEWLDKFEDDYHFIAVNVNLDRNTKTAIGNRYFGAKMTYVDSIHELSQKNNTSFYAACMCSLQNTFSNKAEIILPVSIYNTLSFPLLCREEDEKFTDIENEFRIMAYDCPRIKNGLMEHMSREVMISAKTGVQYTGFLESNVNTTLKSSLQILTSRDKLLSEILAEENGMITIDSKFKSIDISEISDDYRYLGGKKECAAYIKEMLKCKPKEKYVNKTIVKKYRIGEIPDAAFTPGYMDVEY